ncbi:phosphoribosyltransferase [uncultured Ramlibacter sp.]|uniref:phosphoribosyltransferase n=1 Tax=uncultured Ramlibacter sp. TaxID=260755 RepID=UPI00260858F0|nr:phosphoribosyltransferase [uncultured Ramlibacter sp.]
MIFEPSTDPPRLQDRRHAGRVLARRLAHYRGRPNLLVLALPRGGVAVGFEVAHALAAPLDILMVRKLGFPGHEEYAIGALASGGVRVMNTMPGIELPAQVVDAIVAREQAELERRELLYRDGRPALGIRGRTVIVVDDGLATGSTMRCALLALRQQHPAHLVAAVPVGALASCQALDEDADEVVCAFTPSPFQSVGQWYQAFPQSSDEEVHSLLEEARRERTPAPH